MSDRGGAGWCGRRRCDRLPGSWSARKEMMAVSRPTDGRTTAMTAGRFPEERIVRARRQAESGTPAVEACRTLGVTEQAFSP